MQIQLSPKQMFRDQKELAEKFNVMATSAPMRVAALHALSEYATNHNPTREELGAVNEFMRLFLNIAQDEPQSQSFPTKTVSMTDPAAKLRK